MKLHKVADKTGPEPAPGQPWPLAHVKVLDAPPTQDFSEGFVKNALAEGWLSIGRGVITIEAEPVPVQYRIVRGPGHYCCHCGQKLEGQVEARAHVAELHAGESSPDPQNPSGYADATFYSCERVD